MNFQIITLLSKACLLLASLLLLSGCVTANNHCGNEQRDWDNLQFPKSRYCSVPAYVPFSKQYESANKAVCKVHDNNSGKYSTMSQREADQRFLCDYIKHSKFPVGVRHVTGYLSYAMLRLVAPNEVRPERQAQASENSLQNSSERNFKRTFKNTIEDDQSQL